MKEAWRLVASDGARSASEIVAIYCKCRTIEPSLRDSKDLRFGMGLSEPRIGDPQRRDRRAPLNAFAILPLTNLGEADESLGLDRQLPTSTAKRRVRSLFRQGRRLYEPFPNIPKQTLQPLIETYAEVLGRNALFAQTFGLDGNEVMDRGSTNSGAP